MSSARTEVLARIAQALAAAPPPTLAFADIDRDYRTTSDQDDEALVERLVDRLLDYKAFVRRCAPSERATTSPRRSPNGESRPRWSPRVWNRPGWLRSTSTSSWTGDPTTTS